MKKRFIFAFLILLSSFSLFAQNNGYTYYPLEYIYIDATKWMNINIPYYLPSADTTYSWELSFSDLTSLSGRCGSLVGVYDGNRSGYFYSDSNQAGGTIDKPKFQICVGVRHFGTKYQIGGRSEKNTLSAKYTHSGSGGTYEVSDTLGIIGNKNTGTWEGNYAWGPNNQFSLVACARYNYGKDNLESSYEFCSFKFYNVKIYEEVAGQMELKIDLIPVIRVENGTAKACVLNKVDNSFIDFPDYMKVPVDIAVITLNSDGADNHGITQIPVAKGSGLTKITELPSKNGYYFDGYYSGQNGQGTKYYDCEGNGLITANIESDITLYACFKQHFHNGISFNSWIRKNELPSSGNYFLENDIILSSNVTLSDGVKICLNGHSITGGTVFVNGSNYIINNSQTMGTVTNVVVNKNANIYVSGAIKINSMKLKDGSVINVIDDITQSSICVDEAQPGIITSNLKANGKNPDLGNNIWVKLPDSTYGVLKTKAGELKVIKRN